MKKILKIFYKILVLSTLIVWLVPAASLIIFACFVRLFNKKLANSLSGFSAASIWTLLLLCFKITADLKIPNIPKESYLVISNHLGAADFMLINSLNIHMLPHSKYAFKQILNYFVPFFYFWSKSSNQLVLDRNFKNDKFRIKRFVSELVENKLPAWIVLFCEGTRFTLPKKVQSDVYCKSQGIEPFRNVLCPRVKGFTMIQENLKDSHIRRILDLTFYCEKGNFTLFNVLFGGETINVVCDARVIDIDLQENPEKFIFETFRRKDDLIDLWKGTVKTE